MKLAVGGSQLGDHTVRNYLDLLVGTFTTTCELAHGWLIRSQETQWNFFRPQVLHLNEATGLGGLRRVLIDGPSARG